MGNEGEHRGASREKQNRKIADIPGSSLSDYRQPAVGSSFRWLRIEQFNGRSMNTEECQAGMAKCKDVFPESTFLDVPLHLGNAPRPNSRVRINNFYVSEKKNKKQNHAFPSRYSFAVCCLVWEKRLGASGRVDKPSSTPHETSWDGQWVTQRQQVLPELRASDHMKSCLPPMLTKVTFKGKL